MRERQLYQWNAKEYAKHSSAQFGWALELIDKLHLDGHESVLDVGCGDGKVTAEIARQVPSGTVIGIDNSAEMISLAKATFPANIHSNLIFMQLDVRDVSFCEQFEAIFSNATLHWIIDHSLFLPRLNRALKKSGRILLQMGGKGNAGDVVEAAHKVIASKKWHSYFHDFVFPYGFYGEKEYRQWLPEAGLIADRIELIPKDMKQKGKTGFLGWLRTTWHPYTEMVPDSMQDELLDEIAETYLLSHPADDEDYVLVGMVRLEVEAHKNNH
jgi:trans-aconitate 2-methyltransferase